MFRARVDPIHPADVVQYPRLIADTDPPIYKAANYLAADLFRHNPELTNRIWYAAGLIASRATAQPHPWDTPHVVLRVKDNGRFHPVTRWENNVQCDCIDATDFAPKVDGIGLCAHLLAYKIHKLSRIEPDPFLLLHRPKDIYASRLRTGARVQVVGILDRRDFIPLPSRQTRHAYEGEVVWLDGRFWHLTANHNGQRLKFEPVAIPDAYHIHAEPMSIHTTNGRYGLTAVEDRTVELMEELS